VGSVDWTCTGERGGDSARHLGLELRVLDVRAGDVETGKGASWGYGPWPNEPYRQEARIVAKLLRQRHILVKETAITPGETTVVPR
jgi:hypothetical protein